MPNSMLSAPTGAIPGQGSTTLEEKFLEASEKGELEKIQACLTLGVNVNCRNKYDETALTLASYEGRTKVVELLLENGAEIDNQDQLKYTALMVAIVNGHIEIVQLLLDSNANLLLKDDEGDTALDWAYSKKGETDAKIYKDIVELVNNTIKRIELEKTIAKIDAPVFSI